MAVNFGMFRARFGGGYARTAARPGAARTTATAPKKGTVDTKATKDTSVSTATVPGKGTVKSKIYNDPNTGVTTVWSVASNGKKSWYNSLGQSGFVG